MFFWKFLNHNNKDKNINIDIQNIVDTCRLMENNIILLNQKIDNLHLDGLLKIIDKLEKTFNLKLAEKEYQLELVMTVKEDYKRIIAEMQEKLVFIENENKKLIEALQKLGINI